MKNILVTGGAGFIGSHTVLELVENGFNPIIVDNFCNSEKFILQNINELCNAEIKTYELDCTELSQMQVVFQENDIHGVIHFAAYKAVAESFNKSLDYHRNNVNSMTVILECMRQFEISNLVFSSSCTVYGDPDEFPVNEDSPKNSPTSPYGASKVYCEQILRDLHVQKGSNLNGVMLRYFNPIGAHPSGKIGELPLGSPNNLVPYITQTAAGLREKLTIFGRDYETPDGTCVRDYIHVVDVARAHVLALKWISEKSNQLSAFNLGSGKGNSVLEVVKAFEKVSGEHLNYEFGERRIGDVAEVWADPSLAVKTLNWQAKYSLNDAMLHAWNWEKKIRANSPNSLLNN